MNLSLARRRLTNAVEISGAAGALIRADGAHPWFVGDPVAPWESQSKHKSAVADQTVEPSRGRITGTTLA